MKITNHIHFKNVRGDVFGGLTAAVIALPMALAFGVASGAGPAAGLWGAILVGFFAAFFGGTPTLISEPTGPMTVVMTAVIAHFIAANPDDPVTAMAMAFTVVMMAGVFQILFGLLRLGKYVTLMPYTVISGFMSGIGVILIILQTAPFLGQKGPPGGVLGTVTSIPELFANINPIETILGVMSVVIIILTPKSVKRFVPPQLAALILGTIASLVFFSDVDIRRISDVSDNITIGLPSLVVPTFSANQMQVMFADAIVLGMLGCIDALLTSLVADSLTRTEHDSNKELIGQGIGNLVSGLFGGIPGAGATMGTVVNIQTGGRTALSGITRALILLVVVLFAAPLTQSIPLAVLAGIALKVGIDIVDWGFLKRAHKISWKAALIMYGVILLTVFVDLIVAVGVGVFVANILTIERLSNLRSEDVKAITYDDEEIHLHKEEKELLDRAQGRVVLFYLSGPMIFGVAKAISREHMAVDNFDVLILDLSDVPILGVTASLALENAIQEAVEKERQVFVVGATGKTLKRLKSLGLDRFVPEENMQFDRLEALRQAVAVVTRSGSEPPASVGSLNVGTSDI
ncbi:SulP family inorganic anion transporter [Oscillatoriales cyanobacterium LEGE 11467]|uniref:SulP family inorganic anion transporter n=1 Tax=Zarconia navalis LEGE 11467 TaxID=1828826 RepID=A0A928ZB48_9CYAN|nr:SulP family inorganic anion transporter [Zarconia navalis]MBE9042296.1 SulP family inorganic anion transporter [Zarconia navalis LEGE 11467]